MILSLNVSMLEKLVWALFIYNVFLLLCIFFVLVFASELELNFEPIITSVASNHSFRSLILWHSEILFLQHTFAVIFLVAVYCNFLWQLLKDCLLTVTSSALLVCKNCFCSFDSLSRSISFFIPNSMLFLTYLFYRCWRLVHW